MFTYLTRTLFILLFLVIPFGQASAQPIKDEPSILALREAPVSPLNVLQRTPFVPVRIFEVDAPETATVGEPVVFSARVNVRDVTLPAEMTWTFDDGIRLRGLSVERTFDEPGLQRVRFQMSNAGSSQERTVQVRVVQPNPDDSLHSTHGDLD